MPNDTVLTALREFAKKVTEKMNSPAHGEPEEQLRNPFESFVEESGKILGFKEVRCTGETLLEGRIGKPDYAILNQNILVGYVELKAPGLGADTRRFTGHNKEQAQRFAAIPNLLYCDGNEWGLYRNGIMVGQIVHLKGRVETDGGKAATSADAETISSLICDFLSWEPIVPSTLKGLSALLAPLCRMLRDSVVEAQIFADSPLVQLAKEWRQLLFPDASDEQFADAYAQTVTFALLLARSQGADPLTLKLAWESLDTEHSLLSRALQILTDKKIKQEISASVDLLVRIIGAVPLDMLKEHADEKDPWLFFYEDFLAEYDPKLRRNAGAYYTPVEVVRAQIRLVDDILTNKFHKRHGFADSDVITLDPAVGTGTYLLGIIKHALDKVKTTLESGVGGAGTAEGQTDIDIAGWATTLAKNIYGFEIMVGPFAVSELRVSRALTDKGATLPEGGSHIYLADTLESPNTQVLQLPIFYEPIAQQHAKALKVKAEVPVIVCLGNPPYDRHQAADDTNRTQTGNWVRWGDNPNEVEHEQFKRICEDGQDRPPILEDFIEPVKSAGYGVHLKNLYNLYVYFWRWALWEVFEHKTTKGPGIVSFISASSYLAGNAFGGMRKHMRHLCDEIWILDLGGEGGRGSRKNDNVFAIQTPVAIAVAIRKDKTNENKPAKVHYAAFLDGSRDEKLQALDKVANFKSLTWQDCPDGWQTPFMPMTKGAYSTWPKLIDLMPWQHSGSELTRTWPISTHKETLEERWRGLLTAKDRLEAFKESRDRKIINAYRPLPGSNMTSNKPIAELPRNAPLPRIERYAYRSFDRQWILADSRLGDSMRPPLWATYSERQVYLASLLTKPLGGGPALTVSALVPDRDFFSGRGGKDIIPLYRDAECQFPNILANLLEMMENTYERQVSAEDFAAYIYGVLAQPRFTERFSSELAAREFRVPLTKDPALFAEAASFGAELLWLHTFCERCMSDTSRGGLVPKGKARPTKAIPHAEYPDVYRHDKDTKTLFVGSGEFHPVEQDVYEFNVSSLNVVQSWLNYRMKNPKDKKKSSPLDDITPANAKPGYWPSEFTEELLDLLWVLEATLAKYPAMAGLLDTITSGPCFKADELPEVPDAARKKPTQSTDEPLFEDGEED